MSISKPGHEEIVGGKPVKLLLRNGEIERFEEQYPAVGIFTLWDFLCGRGQGLRSGHVRDLVALGLVGGGMSDRDADAMIAALPPSENVNLRGVAQRLLAVTLFPDILTAKVPGKKRAGSRPVQTPASGPTDTTSAPGS